MNILSGRPPVSGASIIVVVVVVLIAFQLGGQCQPTGGQQMSSSSTVGELLKQTKTNKRDDNNQRHEADCDYDKSKWTDCNEAGVQERVLTLKRRQSQPASGRCEPVRTIRRDCKPVGCKYARGQWSSGCLDGRRVRVDTLVGAVGKSGAAAGACKRERRVTKDCRRACHYVKSAWSECSNGVRTRNLTLDETPPANNSSGQRPDEPPQPPNGGLLVSMAPAGQRCARQKLVRRDCRPAPAPSTPAGRAARRRLKQKKQKELQQRQASADPADPASPATNTGTATATTTTTTTSMTPKGKRRR